MNNELLCPYCGQKVYELVKKSGAGGHFKKCRKNSSSKNPAFVDVALYNYKEYATKEFIQQKIEKEGYSVLEMDQLYLKGYCRQLAEYYGIKLRTIHDSASNKRTREKYKKTCLERYGAENVCAAGTPGRKKAEKTMKEKYGVLNFFSIPNFQDYLIQRMGIEEYHKRKSERSKKSWLSKTEEEKNKWLERSILSSTQQHNWISDVEKRFVKSLIDLGFEIETQLKLLKSITSKKNYYFYDVRLKDTNILIEFQGDYWHASPLIYCAEDLITYPGKKLYAKDVWTYDLEKKQVAEKNGYILIYIWEHEFNSINFIEILFDKLIKEVDFENIKIVEHTEN